VVEPGLSLPDLFQQRAQQFAKYPAILFAGQTLHYDALDEQSSRVATGLHALGVRQGQRVALYCPNSDTFVLAYLGILKAGGTLVPINLLLNPKEIAYIMHDAEVTFLIYHAVFEASVNACLADLTLPVQTVGIGETSAHTDWAALLSSPVCLPALTWQVQDDIAVIIYTSGTTGHPKGAMLTHHNLISNTRSVNVAMRLEAGKDVLLVVLPMFHAFAATVGLLTPLLHGLSLVPMAKFDPALVAQTIATHHVSIFLGVPSMYNVLLRLPDAATAQFAGLRFCVSGGAAMPVDLMQRFEQRFGVNIYEGDGPSECSPVTSINPIGGVRKAGSIGLPIPDVDMKILDEAGDPVPLGDIGEICVRGPNVMKGYLNQPEETAKAFFGDWFRTGDLGSEDSDGYFYIVDRKKDMIIVNGMNVYPRVLEEVLYQYPDLIEVAVVGEPSERHGEIVVAHVVLKAGVETSSKAIRHFCKAHVGSHEVPKKVVFLSELPKNAAGKIVKRALRKHGELARGVVS